jgi:cytochrome oxidase Cu insertion factor (SCO1/SenC/PrrC family)
MPALHSLPARRPVIVLLTVALVVVSLLATGATARPAQAAPAADRQTWQDLPLTDARTGATFSLGSFAGKTVYVEPMATWCTTCPIQLDIVRDVRTQLDPDKYVFVALSIETDLAGDELARYADQKNWPWTFAVMSPELLRQLSETYGLTVANPPSTPHFIIDPNGSASELSTGIHSAQDIIADLAPG